MPTVAPNISNKFPEIFYMDDPRFRIRPVQQLVAAISGGLITSLFMTPLDVVKTRIQLQQKATGSNKCYLYCNGLMDHLCPCGPNTAFNSKNPIQLNGTLDALLKISRAEGVGSLWSGLGPTLVLALPATVIYFVAYEQIKQRLWDYYNKFVKKEKPIMPFYIPLVSGMTARVLAVTVVCPLELIRTKMQSQKLTYTQLNEAIKISIKQEGILSLWRGLPPTIYRDVPFSGIYWTSYEFVKSLFDVQEPTFGFSFMAGATSGSIAAFFTTPFDVVKTHQQIEFGEKVIYAENPSKEVPQSTIKALQEIIRHNGIKGAFAGLVPRLFRVTPACAIMIASFEYGKSFFYKYNIDRYTENHSSISHSHNNKYD